MYVYCRLYIEQNGFGCVYVHVYSLFLQSTEDDGGGKVGGRERESQVFPEQGNEELILCMTLTQDFLIYATQVYTHAASGLNLITVMKW